jgi:hypothetical protein
MLRKGRLHRRIGRYGILYGVLVWIMGVTVMLSRIADRVRLGELDEARFQALPPSTDMLVFPVLFGLAPVCTAVAHDAWFQRRLPLSTGSEASQSFRRACCSSKQTRGVRLRTGLPSG